MQKNALEKYISSHNTTYFYEWYVFNSCEQTKGESIDNYITCLRKLLLPCEFGTITDELICDRVVIGLVDTHECCFASNIGKRFFPCLFPAFWWLLGKL